MSQHLCLGFHREGNGGDGVGFSWEILCVRSDSRGCLQNESFTY